MITIKDLGKEAEDKITGFKGIVIGVSQWLTGCNQACLKPKVDKDGKLEEGQWFDEGEVFVIGKGITSKEVESKANGGPRRDQPRR